ncbi:MAG TPA: hypothetical protein VKA46_01920 [Gemmataceae bacterium]|nr:hypothetical protein [Gemmataceae bacterium]
MAYRFAGILILIGCVLVAWAYRERDVSVVVSDEPEEIALKDLIARGPDGNANIILKDYGLGQNFVIRMNGNSWAQVWVPVIPSEGTSGGEEVGDVKNVQAIIMSTQVQNKGELVRHLGVKRLAGMVTNRITKLGAEEKRLLRQSYPTADLERCLIIEDGRQPSGVGKVMLLGAGGIGLVLAGIGVLIVGYLRRER